MTSRMMMRRWDSAVSFNLREASRATLTDVSNPNVESVPDRSLSIVFGTPTTLTLIAASLAATPRVSSPPMAMMAYRHRAAMLAMVLSLIHISEPHETRHD